LKTLQIIRRAKAHPGSGLVSCEQLFWSLVGAPAPLVKLKDIIMYYSAVAWCTFLVFFTGVPSINIVHSREIPTFTPESYVQTEQSQTNSNPLELFIRPKRSTQLKLCGNQLINMLSIICRLAQSSRGNSKYEADVEDLGHNSLNRHSKHIFRKKRSLENYSNTVRHSLSGLVSSLPQGLSTRCCVSSCSMHQLMGAC